jgi:hypothetical protein
MMSKYISFINPGIYAHLLVGSQKIKEPIWYINYYSKKEKRNQRTGERTMSYFMKTIDSLKVLK